ncbi:unnamed protein product [Caenorhabditis nigoni]
MYSDTLELAPTRTNHTKATKKPNPNQNSTSCSPSTYPQTFLFAYSNDLPSATVVSTWNTILYYNSFFSWYGSVRFDTENINMEFHKTKNELSPYFQHNQPDPNQGFKNPNIGSNVFDVIEKFFSNTEAPVCGSIICILLKRYPNEADSSRLASLIRSHHSIVHVITSATPSGGSEPKTMYSVASKTNGIGAFEYDNYFQEVTAWLQYSGNPYYATNVQVSGTGTKILPDFHPPQSGDYWIAVTFQDHVPIDSLKMFNLRWTNSQDPGNLYVSWTTGFWEGGTYMNHNSKFYNINYKMALDYNYSGKDVQNLQIRIYSYPLPNNWLPYSD